MLLVLAASPWSFAQSPFPVENEGGSVLVGRISHVEGWVLRYIPEEREWERTIKDTPFGLEDKVRTDKGARVEMILPNNTWARMNELSQVELVSLKNDETAMHMVYGAGRFYNRGSDSQITVTTPFGYVTSPGNTSFDLSVSDTSLEVISLKGSVFFSRENDRSRHEVIAGSSSLVADGHRVAAGMGSRDSQWDAWNAERDNLWARRMRAGGPSAKYIPPVLDDQGASGTKRDRSGTPEIQRPSAGPTEDRMKSGGGEKEIPRHGKPEREFKGTVKEDSPGNAPKKEISSPEKAEQQSTTAPTEDKRGRPSRAPNQDRQMEPEKKQQQQRGARGRE